MRKNLALIFFTVFLYLLGFGVIIPILPLLSKSFGANAFQTGLLMSSYSLMQFFFAPMWGRLSDRRGRRPILVYCLLGEGLSYILFAFARSWEVLLLARLLAGFFAASISTASAYISDVTPRKERSRGMALIGMAFGLGFIVGPALGGQLAVWGTSISKAEHFGTTFTILWVSVLCLATFVFAFFNLKESLITKAEVDADHRQEKRHRIYALIQHLKVEHVGTLILAFGLLSVAMSAMEATLVLHVDEKFHWGIQEVSYGFAYIGMVMVFTQGVLVRRVVPRFGENKVLLAGVFLFSIGMLGIALAPTISILAVAMTLFSVGNGLTNPTLLGSISLLTPPDEQGATLGVTQSFASLGRILGPMLGGLVYQAFYSQSPFFAGFFLGAVALGLLMYNFRSLPSAGRQSELTL